MKLYGELAAFINLANEHPRSKGTGVLPVRWLRGLEATYTEHGSITSETPKNRSKSRACNHREFTLPPVSI